MTLREAISFGFQKVTVTTENSGCGDIYHYFIKKINNVDLMIDVDKEGNWFGTIFDMGVKFYPVNLFRDVVSAVEKGQWDAEI